MRHTPYRKQKQEISVIAPIFKEPIEIPFQAMGKHKQNFVGEINELFRSMLTCLVIRTIFVSLLIWTLSDLPRSDVVKYAFEISDTRYRCRNEIFENILLEFDTMIINLPTEDGKLWG